MNRPASHTEISNRVVSFLTDYLLHWLFYLYVKFLMKVFMKDFVSLEKNIGLTGASGFVGCALVEKLRELDYKLHSFGRSRSDSCHTNTLVDFASENWSVERDLEDVKVMIHCAARTHIINETTKDPLEEYLRFNTASTLNLAKQAASAGVRRFIYISSVKALGESTTGRKPFSNTSPLNPEDNYGISKAQAEEGLKDISRNTGMEVTIIRPPLVYGLGVKANFASMIRLARLNLPLPFASIRNKRSLVALDNIIDLILICINSTAAADQTFMVSDGDDISTPELFSAVIRAHGMKPRLLPCPPKLLLGAAAVLGKRNVADRLLGSLEVDIQHTKQVLGWAPRVSFEDVLRGMIRDSAI